MIELKEHVLPLMVQIWIYSKRSASVLNICPVTFTNLKRNATAQIITSVNEAIKSITFAFTSYWVQHKSLSIEIYVLIKKQINKQQIMRQFSRIFAHNDEIIELFGVEFEKVRSKQSSSIVRKAVSTNTLLLMTF